MLQVLLFKKALSLNKRGKKKRARGRKKESAGAKRNISKISQITPETCTATLRKRIPDYLG
jgi:hypothetical protein